MHQLAGRPYARMNGLGNEILVLDLRGRPADITPADVQAISRGEGLAFDQMMVLSNPTVRESEALVTIYNIDGSEAGACGNGMRCVAWYLMGRDGHTRTMVQTKAGLLSCEQLSDWTYRVDMGPPNLDAAAIPLSRKNVDTRAVRLDPVPPGAEALGTFAAVSMGNPHAIFFVDRLDVVDLGRVGPLLEHHPLFPERANISLARIRSRNHIVVKVWERGAGLTQACGSAACATAVAAARAGLAHRDVRISLPGGDLEISWRASDDHVLMTGPCELAFEGHLDDALFEETAA